MTAHSEVQLYLLRHAHAGDPMKWQGPDDARPLSEKGREQAETMGRFLARVGFEPDVVLSSPKLRALQTAKLVAKELQREVVEEPALAEPLDVHAIEHILAAAGNPERAVLVGHDPDFSEVLCSLTGAPGLELRKGALARVDLPRPLRDGAGVLRWLVPPDLLHED